MSGSVIKRIIGATWLISFLPLLLRYAISVKAFKVLYYLLFEGFITVLTVAFLVATKNRYKKRDDRFPKMNERKTFTTSLLLLVFFILFNAVPDFIFYFHQEHSVYVIVSFVWSAGCLIDPVVYIFLNKETARIAARLLCYPWFRQQTGLSALLSLSKSDSKKVSLASVLRPDSKKVSLAYSRPRSRTMSLPSVPKPDSRRVSQEFRKSFAVIDEYNIYPLKESSLPTCLILKEEMSIISVNGDKFVLEEGDKSSRVLSSSGNLRMNIDDEQKCYASGCDRQSHDNKYHSTIHPSDSYEKAMKN